MTLRLTNRGEGLALEYLVNKTAPENLILRLFVNDHTPVDADVVGDYTEASFTGYAAVTLSGASWGVTDGNPAVAVYAEQTFQATIDQIPQTVYGYYLTRETGGELVWAERFPFSQVMEFSGNVILITPRIEAKDTLD